jgi:hypothetical protein
VLTARNGADGIAIFRQSLQSWGAQTGTAKNLRIPPQKSRHIMQGKDLMDNPPIDANLARA